MINHIYQLIKPKFINVKYKEEDLSNGDKVIIRPNYMAVCHADQRYYQGKRDPKILAKKLPMALIHECCGVVIADPTGTYKVGQHVVMIPNQPPRASDEEMYENYMPGTHFLSSGFDGFMREFIALPADRVVPYNTVDDSVAAITEFISVGMHAMERFLKDSHSKKERIAIIGDGSLAFVMANIVNYTLPETQIIVIGRHWEKLELFSFAKETYLTDDIPADLTFDHGFECCGGDGSGYAINDIIKYIKPQGSLVLMGVSEYHVSINTRDILEKGLTLIGSSRSGRSDFEKAIAMLEDKKFERRFKNIIYLEQSVKNIGDIHKIFASDLNNAFKTVFKWDI
ncbi:MULTISPECIES: ribitol-5-phosphate dehydrogenase [Gemella]|uniref:ribitol-5-phosphate dehydrogenase n=1 Tax=Gemella TaxID=1378 RepID=UPI0007684D49|nr:MULTISPECIES: ribitol-5-phosphate dehydrogenase [Gemella]AME08884.1 ribitol-5-phosphate dehydrogenase [Gemella sp. oral taxon 928]AXI26456.1 ribitol-5-phosphate dehydrogenase [Gemella sp. ND 6198]